MQRRSVGSTLADMATCMPQVPEGSDRRPLVTYPLVIRMECLGEAAQKDGHTLAVRGCHAYSHVPAVAVGPGSWAQGRGRSARHVGIDVVDEHRKSWLPAAAQLGP